MFWVASAPWRGKHVNISPKGMPGVTFTIFDGNHCAYVDATGSGSETIAHLYENGRITLCWCSFDTMPRILRFYCWGRVIETDSPEFRPMLVKMGHERVNGARAIIDLKVWKVGTSCGMSVPLLEAPQGREEELVSDSSLPMETHAARHFVQRESLKRWAGKMEEGGKMAGYRQLKNTTSLDGLPSIRVARKEKGFHTWVDVCRVFLGRTLAETRGMAFGALVAIIAIVLAQSLGIVGVCPSF